MNKKLLLTTILGMAVFSGAVAQRTTDKLDRGLVAVPAASGNYCSWRILADEYYDVTYNIYRDGVKLNSMPLTTSNYTDNNGSASSSYQVEAVVRGKAGEKSKAVTPWTSNYKTITIKHDASLKSTYVPNDACMADVDGDGELEILMKFDNSEENAQLYPKNGPTIDGVETKEYSLLACLKQDGTVLWWVNCGPNMGDFQNNEQNIVGYDWDMDGKAEVVMRLEEGSTVHMADGTTYTIGADGKNGTSWTNYRTPKSAGSVEWFTHYGNEFLFYCDGATGKPYQCVDFPLRRYESGETDLKAAWGDGYGHRSSKFFFGAPYLDGRKPSIFMARGIYTRHKMIAFDVNPATHELVERWRWNCNNAGSPWYGQGYHNFGISDVDWDGRDEIVFGSMVIDDNGKGLSTTGLGHGDSQHVSDFDPFTHGQEIFACNEDNPNNNFRDATTSKIYYRTTGGNDDGRCLMGNFLNDYPGAQGISSRDNNLISSVTHNGLTNDNKGTVSVTQNFRIYWDGDLCEESFDYNSGRNTQGAIYKAREGRIALLEGSMTNNDTKGTPCYQGDIMGDWREEVMMRTADNNIRIYTTNIETPWRNYSLWYDHQYRNAMVWQMCGYNQTPHTSYFLGELEGITKAPAPLTMAGREEVNNGGSIGSAHTDKHVILCETGDATVSVSSGATPYIFTDNAPTWVQGHDDNDNITTTTYTHTVTGGAFGGEMRLVKQGDGVLTLPNVVQTYSGPTDIWAGTLNFDGTMQNSHVWMNRFAELNSNGGKFPQGIEANYGAIIRPGGKANVGTMETGDLTLNFGSKIEFDVNADGTSDCITVKTLKIEKKDWQEGPEYNAPVFVFNVIGDVKEGSFNIMAMDRVEGDIADIKVLGLDGMKSSLKLDGNTLKLEITKLREAASVVWTGSESGVWDFYNTYNFTNSATSAKDGFVSGDNVVFDDNAAVTAVNIAEDVYPKSVVFRNNSKNYTIDGSAIAGSGSVTVEGTGTVEVKNTNTYTGGTSINGGTLRPAMLGNTDGMEYGSLGNATAKIALTNNGTLNIASSITSTQPLSVSGEGKISVDKGVTFIQNGTVTQPVSNSTLYKTGAGSLTLGATVGTGKLVINEGTVNAMETNNVINLPRTVVFDGKNVVLDDVNNLYSYSTNNANVEVTEGSTATWRLDSRCAYKGTLKGKGTISVVARGVRNDLNGNWSAFEGTMNAQQSGSSVEYRWFNTYGLPKATLNISSGVTVNCENRNINVGNLRGSGNLQSGGTITIGGLGENISFSGSFVANGSSKPAIVKQGAGRWTVSKVINTVKSVRVDDGMLYLNNTTSNVLFPSLTLNVAGSGVLGGKGYVENVVVASGATLQPGTISSTYRAGAIKATGSIIMNEGSHLVLFLNRAQEGDNYHAWIEAPSLTINGDITLELYSNYKPAIGDEVVFWKANSVSGTLSAVNLPELPEGMQWNTDNLMTSGVVRIVEATGIDNISANEEFKGAVYTLNGVKVADITTTKATLNKDVKALGVGSGIYVVRTAASTAKVIIK